MGLHKKKNFFRGKETAPCRAQIVVPLTSRPCSPGMSYQGAVTEENLTAERFAGFFAGFAKNHFQR